MFKFNNGNGAVICDICRVITKAPASVADSKNPDGEKSPADFCAKHYVKTTDEWALETATTLQGSTFSGDAEEVRRKMADIIRQGMNGMLRERAHVIDVSAEEAVAIADMVEHPAPPTAALRKAMSRKTEGNE